MKKVLLGITAIVVVGLAALLLAPSFIDWNQQKARIAHEVYDATGERVIIEGDVSLTLLPTPRLSAAGVRLAGAEGEPDRLTLNSLDLQVALAPLLGGEIEVASLMMVEPVVLYEVDGHGRANWSFDPGEGVPGGTADTGAATGERGDQDLALRVHSLKVEGGTLIYRDLRTDSERRIQAIDADLSADSLSGPFRLDGRFTYAGEAFDLTASLGRLDRPSGGSSRLTLTAANLGDAKLAWEGSVAPDDRAARGTLTVSGLSLADLAAFADQVGADLPAPELDYELAADLSYGNNALMVEDAALHLGSSRLLAAGRIAAEPGKAPDVRLELAAARIDLDELLAALPPPDSNPGADGNQSSKSEPQTVPLDLPFLGQATGRVDATVDALVYRGDTLRNAVFRGSFDDSGVLLETLGATLPGGAEAVLSGKLTRPAEGAAFDGGLEIRANDLRQTLGWLGQEVSGVADDRLRRLILVTDVSARIAENGDRLDFNNLTADLDASRLRGGIATRLGARPGIGVGLSVDHFNLDAYLGSPSSTPPRDVGQETAAALKGEATGDALHGIPALAVLDRFDANFDLHAEELVVSGGAIRELRARGSLLTGALTFSELTADSFPGGAGRVSGRLTGLTDRPQLADGQFDLSLREPLRLLRYLDLPVDDMVARLGPLTARGDISGDAAAVSLSIDVSGLGGRGQSVAILRDLQGELSVEAGSLSLSGMDGASVSALLGLPATHPLSRLGVFDLALQANGSSAEVDYDLSLVALGGRVTSQGMLSDYLAGAPRLGDVRFAIEGIEAGRLVALAGLPEIESVTRLGPVTLTSTMNGPLDDLSYATRLAALDGELRAAGTAQNLSSGLPDFAFDLTVAHESLQRPLASLFPEESFGHPGALDLSAKVTGSPLKLTMAGLQAQAGRTSLQGNLALDMTAARPRIDTELAFGDLMLSDFLANGAEQGGDGDTSADQGGPEEPAWSRRPLPLDLLRQYDGTFVVSFASLNTGDMQLDDVVVDAQFEGGVLTLERFDSDFGGGSLAVVGGLDAADPTIPAEAAWTLDLERIPIGPLLRMAGVEHQIEGLIDLDGRFAARGSSQLEMISTLNGDGSAQGDLSFQPGGLEQGANLVAGLLGGAVRQVQGFTDPVNALFGAFGQAPAALSLTYQAERGVLRSDDILLQGQGARVNGQGVMVDLPRLSTALDLAVTLGEDSTPYLTVALAGPLDAPNTSFGGDILRRGINVDPSGRSPGSPGDIIEGIVGGVLGVPPRQDSPPSGELPSEENSEPEQTTPDPREQLLRGIFKGVLNPK